MSEKYEPTPDSPEEDPPASAGQSSGPSADLGGNGAHRGAVEDVSAQEESAQDEELSDVAARQELIEELDDLIERLKEVTPGYEPPSFSPRRLVRLITENLGNFSPEFSRDILERLRTGIAADMLDLDTWRGIWYMLNYTIEYQTDLINRRMRGDYEVDEWGFDQEALEVVKPFFDFLYYRYWRVQAGGLENIPDEGRALLVSNHSGQLPFDGAMVALSVYNEHPANRMVRTMYATWFPSLPIISDLFVRMGQTLAHEENGVSLLEMDELVAVYPEGYKGVGKLFKDRYRLARFGRGGFVRMALRTSAPMIPVSVVGAEETYISLAKSSTMAKLIGFPYFPISPTFPWFGLLGFVPIPTKWYIDFGEPIPTDQYGPEAVANQLLVSQLTDQVRNVVQEMIYDRLRRRRSVIFG